ncbi:MAG: OB-fold nucleic acid binding domain-containing protein [Candidatus Nanopelagicales bacterium]|nr:OB-fold nucleic acid binding domain-containing protein [Candidatus Nanopelagicales bacterium]
MAEHADDSGIRGKLRRLRSSDAEVEAEELQESSRFAGATAIHDCDCGQVVTVSGPLRSVTLRPVEGIASVEAELYDGTGRVRLIWMGRRHIAGIDPGRVMSATGRLCEVDGQQVIYNPRYALRPIATGE